MRAQYARAPKVAINTDKLTINCGIGNLHSMTQPRALALRAVSPTTKLLSLRDDFELGAVKVVGFEAALRRVSLWKQDLEDAP